MKTHNSSRIIFSGYTLAIKTVTVYSAKFNVNHTVFGNAIHSFSSVVIASCVCRLQNRTDTDFRPHAAGEEPHFTFIDTLRGI